MLAFASPALAGPPLICHPFDTAGGTLIAWGSGSGWNTPLPSYDVKKLPAEVAQLLDTDAPVLTRMENLRRATIYAMKDPAVAHQLLTVVMGRALTPRSGAQAWFDAGYLIESYKQAAHLREGGAFWSRDKAWTGDRRNAEGRRLWFREEGDGDGGRAECRDGICRVVDDAGHGGVGAPRPRGRIGRARFSAGAESGEAGVGQTPGSSLHNRFAAACKGSPLLLRPRAGAGH